jgi:hypothetical protein
MPQMVMTANPKLGGLTRETWDALAGRRFYSTSAWLDLCVAEYGGPEDAAVVRDRTGDPVCAVPVAELESLSLQKWSRYRWNEVLSGFDLPSPPATGLLVGPPEGFQTQIIGSAGAAGRLVEEIRRMPGGDARVAMYLNTRDALAFRDAGVTAPPVLLDVDAWIEVPDGGWPAWLQSRPKHRRDKVRQEVRKFERAGYQVRHLPLSECYEQLAWPAAATLVKYGFKADPAIELISLRRHVTCLGETARVVVCSLGDGDPLGFCIYYVWDDTIYIRWAGFDYDRLAGAAEYFNLLFYEQIKQAADLGVRWIHAGVAATEAKVHRGAQLLPLWLVDLSENSVLDRDSERVRRHNRRLYERFATDQRITGALVDDEAWQGFR